MSVLQKLKDLKRVLDWNLATKSQDILPVINECIKELEDWTENKKEWTEKTIQELKQEYKDKFGKNPFGWWTKEFLIEKLNYNG